MSALMLFLLLFTFDTPEILQKKMEKTTSDSEYSLYSNPVKFVILKAIKLYQLTISKIQGDVCNFIPSCSHYGYDAIRKYDIIKGILMASDRVQRCHGFAILYCPDYYDLKEDSIRGVKPFDPVK